MTSSITIQSSSFWFFLNAEAIHPKLVTHYKISCKDAEIFQEILTTNKKIFSQTDRKIFSRTCRVILEKDSIENFQNSLSKLPLTDLKKLIWLKLVGSSEEVEKYRKILGRAKLQSLEGKNNIALLCSAIINGCLEIVHLLLDQNSKLISGNKLGNLLFKLAVYKGQTQIVRLFLRWDPNLISNTCNEGSTAMWAEMRDVIVSALGENATFTFEKLKNEAPIYLAVFQGQLEVLCLLLQNGNDPNYKEIIYGITLLHVAVDRGYIEIARVLLDSDANPNPKLTTGETPLHQAIRRGDQEMIALLLDKGANPNSKDLMNDTPLHIAVTRRQRGVVQLLLHKGADSTLQNLSRQTARDLTTFYGYEEIGILFLREHSFISEPPAKKICK